MSATPKLYRVRITEIFHHQPRAEITEWWVAARSRTEAQRRAMDMRQRWAETTHVEITCWTGGVRFVQEKRLTAQ